jgi:hypothetical protein
MLINRRRRPHFMKRIFAPVFALSAVTGLVFAQGWVFEGPGPPYDSKKPPPQSLPEAYAVAVADIGAATNRFYCVSATCLEKHHYAGWTFSFSNTNGQTARVVVFFGARRAFIPDSNSAALLK